MARTISGLRNIRRNEKRRLRNKAVKSSVRTYLKRVLACVEKGDKEGAKTAFREACARVDKAMAKGVVHRNKASRHKARLAARVNAIA